MAPPLENPVANTRCLSILMSLSTSSSTARTKLTSLMPSWQGGPAHPSFAAHHPLNPAG
jgi:hypothetical protein